MESYPYRMREQPEDFRVTELADPIRGPGDFSLYRLTKRALTTWEALELMRRDWRIERGDISFGGLKDRQAVTSQHVTIFRGPRKSLERPGLLVEYLGPSPQPFTSPHIRANRFEITLREVSSQAQGHAVIRAALLEAHGLPNYFDDQRFGSVQGHGEFAAVPWCKGDFETALRIMLSAPYPGDDDREAARKAKLREHWGEWPHRALQSEPDSRRVAEFFQRNPGDFRRGIGLVDPEERRMALEAFQSHLWNQALGHLLADRLPQERRLWIPVSDGALPIWNRSPDFGESGESWRLSLPAARQPLQPNEAPYFDKALAPFGLQYRELRVKYPRDSFFSKGDRAVVSRPQTLRLEPQFQEQMLVRFDLARGAYATLVIKALFAI